MIDKCPAGHPFDEANARYYAGPKGKPYRQCRECARKRQRLKYRHDDTYREAEKSRNLDRYYANKGQRSANGHQAEQANDSGAPV